MLLRELYDVIGGFLSRQPRYETFEVMIPLATPSIGHHAATGVTGVHPGIDWDNGRFFLNTQARVVEKTQKEDAFDGAQDLLMYLATKPGKRESYETRSAKRILKSCGYTEEQFEKYRHLFHEDPAMKNFKAGDRVIVRSNDDPVLKYLQQNSATGEVVKIFRNKIRVAIDGSGSQDTEGYPMCSDFTPDQTELLEKK